MDGMLIIGVDLGIVKRTNGFSPQTLTPRTWGSEYDPRDKGPEGCE